MQNPTSFGVTDLASLTLPDGVGGPRVVITCHSPTLQTGVDTGALQLPAQPRALLHPWVTHRSPHLHSRCEYVGQGVAFAWGSGRLVEGEKASTHRLDS